MIQRRALSRKKRAKQRRPEDEERVKSRPAKINSDRFGMLALQQQVGNQAVQRMLGQRQALAQRLTLAQRQAQDQTEEKEAKTLVEAGQVKIEKPEIEEYEVSGNSLRDISNQILPPDQWYEYEYQYKPKTENGVTTQVDVTVSITIHLPRWTGGWEETPDEDKIAWLQMLQILTGNPEGYEGMTELPQQWLGLVGDAMPEAIKGEWQAILQEFQSQEKGPVDIARRRTIVLQQRLYNQSEEKGEEVFEQFQEDVKIEEEAYNEEREFGREQEIILDPEVMVQ